MTTTKPERRISYLAIPTDDTAHEGVKKLWVNVKNTTISAQKFNITLPDVTFEVVP